MIAKIIAWGSNRGEALARLRRALADTMVVVDGGTTNQGFLLALLDRPELLAGEVTTTWLDRLQLRGEIVPVRHADVALLQAAIELSEAETAADRARFYAFARRGPSAVRAPVCSARSSCATAARRYRFAVAQVGPRRHRVTVDGGSVEVEQRRLGAHERRLEVDGRVAPHVSPCRAPTCSWRWTASRTGSRATTAGSSATSAPAVVVSIPVEPGDEVSRATSSRSSRA